MTSRKRLIISIAVLLAVYWVGVAGYLILDRNIRFLDAVYMVAITLATVGYREVVTPTPAVQVWTVIIIVFGVASAGAAIGSLTGLIVEGEVGRLIGSRKLEARIKHVENHVILCGLGRMGAMVARQLLERKLPVVVVDKDPEACRQAEELQILYITGDATDEDSLQKAGIDRARSLVAVLRSDAENVFVTLTARPNSAGPVQTVSSLLRLSAPNASPMC
jgi:voltage-gated potassium channel